MLSLADEPNAPNKRIDDLAKSTTFGFEAIQLVEGPRKRVRSAKAIDYRTPAMIGDFYAGSSLSFGGNSTLDRLFVFANDLDAPIVLPSSSSSLSIAEPGPVGIYSSSLANVQQIQALLRASAPLPSAALVGTVNANASMTSSLNIGQIQALLASTSSGYDIVPLLAPPSAYQSAVNATFLSRNVIPGSTSFNASNSGAILQGGTDSLNGGEDFDAFYFYDYVVRFDTVLADASSGGVGRQRFLREEQSYLKIASTFDTTT